MECGRSRCCCCRCRIGHRAADPASAAPPAACAQTAAAPAAPATPQSTSSTTAARAARMPTSSRRWPCCTRWVRGGDEGAAVASWAAALPTSSTHTPDGGPRRAPGPRAAPGISPVAQRPCRALFFRSLCRLRHRALSGQRLQRVCAEEAHGHERAAAGALWAAAWGCWAQPAAAGGGLLRLQAGTNVPPTPLLPTLKPPSKNAASPHAPQNFFLYLFGVLFNAGGLLLTVAAGGLAPRDVLAGFRPVTVLLVANNALQGWVRARGALGGPGGRARRRGGRVGRACTRAAAAADRRCASHSGHPTPPPKHAAS